MVFNAYIKQLINVHLITKKYSQQHTRSAPVEIKEIKQIYVSESNGYFIGNDLQNALKLTEDFIAKKLKAKISVSKIFINSVF